MDTFIYLLIPTRSDLISTASSGEESIIEEHFAFLKEKCSKGTLILAGPCLDGTLGVVIFKAPSLKEAEAFMNSDPAVKKGVMTAHIHPFRISLWKAP